MRKYFIAAVAMVTVSAIAASSQSAALQVTVSSPKSSFVQGQPIYVWVDYYNDTDEEIGLPEGYLFGFDVLRVRTRDGEAVMRAGVQVTRAPLGKSNHVQQIGAKQHLVFFGNVLDHVNLTDARDYDIQIFIANHAPELFLDPEHPALPASKLVHGPIQSNHWLFTITPGSGEPFDLVAKSLREKTAGTFALCANARTIIEKYSNSVYGPYAVMCEIDDLLYGEEQGQVPLKDRLATAQALVDGLRTDQAGFEYLDVALIRYAERLVKVGQSGAASKLLNELQRKESNATARLYIGNLLARKTEAK